MNSNANKSISLMMALLMLSLQTLVPGTSYASPTSQSNSTLSIMDNPFKYGGYYNDTESGMYYCTGNYYSPELMCYITRDTANILECSSYNSSIMMSGLKGIGSGIALLLGNGSIRSFMGFSLTSSLFLGMGIYAGIQSGTSTGSNIFPTMTVLLSVVAIYCGYIAGEIAYQTYKKATAYDELIGMGDAVKMRKLGLRPGMKMSEIGKLIENNPGTYSHKYFGIYAVRCGVHVYPLIIYNGHTVEVHRISADANVASNIHPFRKFRDDNIPGACGLTCIFMHDNYDYIPRCVSNHTLLAYRQFDNAQRNEFSPQNIYKLVPKPYNFWDSNNNCHGATIAIMQEYSVKPSPRK